MDTANQPVAPPVRQKPENWGLVSTVLISIAVYILPQLAVVLAFGFIGGMLNKTSEQLDNLYQTNAVVQFLLVLFSEAIALGILWRFLKYFQSPLKSLGFTRKPVINDIGAALIGFGVYFVLYLILISGIQALVPGLDIDQEQEIGFDNAQGAALILVFMSLVVLPPVVEEILFRGFMYRGFKHVLPVFAAATITSLLFGMLHLQVGSGQPLLWIAAIDTFALSMILIYLRDKTGAIWAPIFLHALKNFIAFLLLFVFKFSF